MKKNFILCVVVALMSAQILEAVAADEKVRDPREFNYLQIAGGLAMSSSADLKVALGANVRLPGQTQFDKGSLWSITLGQQFFRDEDEAEKQIRLQTVMSADMEQEQRNPMRLELELMRASVTRNTISLAAQTLHPNDKIQPSAVFVNAAIPIGQSDELFNPEDPKRLPEPLWRTWLSAGIGYANSNYPSASVLSGCNCLRDVRGNGLAYQLKLQFERQVDENTYLFGQVGRVWLPSLSTVQGAQNTEYGRWGINNLQFGVKWVSRD